MKNNYCKVDLDIASDDDGAKAQNATLKLVKKAMKAGLFVKLENEGPNGMPLLHLRGFKDEVLAWVHKHYDKDFDDDCLSRAKEP